MDGTADKIINLLISNPKWLFILLFIILVIGVTFYVVDKASSRKKLIDVFVVKPVENPGLINAVMNGVSGDKVRVFVSEPDSETIIENLGSIKVADLDIDLQKFDIGRLASLSKISPEIFKFNIEIRNYGQTIKCNIGGKPFYIENGQKLANYNLRFEELLPNLSKLDCSVVSRGMLGDQFFDEEGKYKSKLNGEIVIIPDKTSKIFVFGIIFAGLVGILILFRELLSISSEFSNWINSLKK